MNKGTIAVCMVVSFCYCLFPACTMHDCSDKYDFLLTKDLLRKANDKGYDYCTVLDRAINGDSSSIVELSLWTFYDGLSAEHGSNLIEIISRIGEDAFYGIIHSRNIFEQYDILLKIEPGFDFTENKIYVNSSLEKAFPLLFEHKTRIWQVMNENRAPADGN